MSDFQFQFDRPLNKKSVAHLNIETWVPLTENPQLSSQEKEAVLFGDVVEELYLVRPAFLYLNQKEKLSFIPAGELEYYFTVAKLKKSPYLVLLGEEVKSRHMEQFLNKNKPKKTFYLDNYLAPHFGTIKPKCHLFEKVSLNLIPNTMVLFREA